MEVLLSKHQREKNEKAESCKSCSKPFTKKNYKVRHHSHSSGNFIGAVCNACNRQLKGRRRYEKNKNSEIASNDDLAPNVEFIQIPYPIIFHNLEAYDAHHLFRYFNPRAVSEFERDEDEDITKYPPIVEITALNLERFIFLIFSTYGLSTRLIS